MPEEKVLRLGVDPRPGEEGFARFERAADRTKGSVSGLESAIIGITTALISVRTVQAIGDFVELGAAVNETGSKYRTVLGPAVDGVNDFLDEFASKAGLTQRAAQDLVGTTAAVAQGMGFAQRESADFAEEIVRLSADLGSFNNLPTEDVARRVTSALAGERESLKALGIVVRETDVQKRALANTGKTVVASLTDQERATATLQIITERAGAAVGDLDRTQDSLANSTRAVAATLTSMVEQLASSAASGIEASGVMAELRDVLDQVNVKGGLTKAVFREIGEEFAETFQSLENDITFIRGVDAALGALFSPEGVRGFRREMAETFAEIRQANDEFKEQHRELTAEEVAQNEALKARREEYDRLIRIRNEAISADERLDAEREAAALAKQIADEKKRAADEEERAAKAQKERREFIAGIFDGIQSVSRYNSDTVQGLRAGGQQVRAEREAAELAQRTAEEFEETTRQLAESLRRLEAGQLSQIEKTAAATQGVVALASGLGLLDANTEQAARGVADFVAGLAAFREADNWVGQLSGAAGLIGGAVGFLGAFFDDGDAQRIEDARANFERVLDDYVAELADATRWESLQSNAESGAREALDALVESIFAGLPDKVRDDVIGQIQAAFDDLDTEKLEEVLSKFGPEGQAILDAYRSHLEQIEQQRQDAIDAMAQNLQVETLRLQGLDDEADALALTIRYQERMAEAIALGDAALQEAVDTWYQAAEAAREAAAAAREEAEAKRQANAASDFFTDLAVLQAQNAGNDDLARTIQLQADAAARIRDAKELLEEGIIDEAAFQAFVEAIGVSLTKALQDAEQAELDAAAAEQFRMEQDLRNLQVQLLNAQGRSKEALILQQQIQLLDAIENERSAEYIATLKTLHAQQRLNFERDQQAAAMREQERATVAVKEAAEGVARVFNAPRGLIAALYKAQTLREGTRPDAFRVGTSSPDFSGGGSGGGVTFQIAEGAIRVESPGGDPEQTGRAMLRGMVAEAEFIERAGGGNLFALVKA